MTALSSLRALIRILDAQGGYMTHEDQQALREARSIAEQPEQQPPPTKRKRKTSR